MLDLSASITADTYSRIHQTLQQLVARGGRYGLVVFSNIAYEALPPGTPASALEPIVALLRAAGEQLTGRAADIPDQSVERDVHERDGDLGRASTSHGRSSSPTANAARGRPRSATSPTTRTTSSG